MHAAPCILAALQRRHVAHSSLRTGAVRRQVVTHDEGTASVERCQHAALTSVSRAPHICVRDLRSGRQQHLWPLRASSRSCELGLPYEWRWGGQALALPYGCLGDPAAGLSAQGVLVMDVSSGECHSVPLPAHGIVPQPSLTSRLPAPRLSRWSSSGHLIAQQSGTSYFAVVGALGQLISAAVLPEPYSKNVRGPPAVWAPSGRHAVLFVRGHTEICIWHVEHGDPVCQQTQGLSVREVAWSPDSARLLITGDTSQVLVWCHAGQRLHTLSEQVGAPAWGSRGRVALLKQRDGRGYSSVRYSQVQLCQLHDGSPPQPVTTLQLGSRHSLIQWDSLSPEGTFVVGTLGYDATHFDWMRPPAVAIVDLHRGCVWECSCDFQPDTSAWASDGATLLVSDRHGTHHMLLDFA